MEVFAEFLYSFSHTPFSPSHSKQEDSPYPTQTNGIRESTTRPEVSHPAPVSKTWPCDHLSTQVDIPMTRLSASLSEERESLFSRMDTQVNGISESRARPNNLNVLQNKDGRSEQVSDPDPFSKKWSCDHSSTHLYIVINPLSPSLSEEVESIFDPMDTQEDVIYESRARPNALSPNQNDEFRSNQVSDPAPFGEKCEIEADPRPFYYVMDYECYSVQGKPLEWGTYATGPLFKIKGGVNKKMSRRAAAQLTRKRFRGFLQDLLEIKVTTAFTGEEAISTPELVDICPPSPVPGYP